MEPSKEKQEGNATAPVFSLLREAINRPVAVTMIALGVAVFGMVAYTRLSVALMPRFSHPALTIRTEYLGSAPEEVEQFITTPLEKALSIVSGLIEVRSVSLAGLSEVVLNFQWGTDLGLALLEVREKLDRLVLPDQVQKPLLLRFDPEEAPILRMALMGNLALSRLRDAAENDIKPALQTLPGVAFIQIGGGAPPEVKVELDEGQLTRLGLSVAGVRARLSEENINLAGGVLLEGSTEYRVRTLNEFASLDEVREVLVSPSGQPPVRLADIAQVSLAQGEISVQARADGQEAVEIEVFKEADANVIAVAARVREAVWGRQERQEKKARPPPREARKSRRRGPPGMGFAPSPSAKPLAEQLEKGSSLRLISDRSQFIDQALREVRGTAVFGALLAMAVLYLFLGRVRTTLIVAVAIPLSVVAAFLMMFGAGLTLNMISLGGLALGVGMLVDNAIVVLEAIHRLRQQGLPVRQAAVEGLGEVSGAVTASTLTTVAVFLPLVFVEGIAGQLFNDLALTVVFSLVASLVVALFLLPMLYVTFMEKGESEERPRPARPTLRQFARVEGSRLVGLARGLAPRPFGKSSLLFPYRAARLVLAGVGAGLGIVAVAGLWAFGMARRGLAQAGRAGFFSWMERAKEAVAHSWKRFTVRYEDWLRWVLERPGLVLITAAGVFVVSLVWGMALERQLIPPLHQGMLQARLELPPGTPLARTSEVVGGLEQKMRGLPGVASTFARIGEEPDAQAAERGGGNVGLIWVRLQATSGLAEAEAQMTKALLGVLRGIPEMGFRVESPPLFTLKPPIQVEILGNELGPLSETAARVETILAKLPQVTAVRAHLRPGNPEIRIQFLRERLTRHGLTAKGVAEIVRGKLEGESALQFRTGDKKVDLRVRVRRPQLDSIPKLAELTVNPGGATPVPLKAVATLESGRGPSEIRRVSQRRTALVTAEVGGGGLGGAVSAVERALAGLALPPGVAVAVSGQSQEMAVSLRSLFFALALAVFLVFLVMASQFESLTQPLLILLSIPLAAIGVVAGLWVTGQTLDVLVGIGLIVLAGIVVNNAIVLVNTVNRLHHQGSELGEAIVAGARTRLRPILMTTATTVLGLLPLVLDSGAGVEIRRPIALTVIAGLVSGMVLTLGVIPAAILMLDAKKTWFGWGGGTGK